MENHIQTLIIGAGPAGYTAGIYLARAGRNPIIVAGDEPGGQLTLTTDVENFPGFAVPIQGPQLMSDMQSQAIACGAVIHDDIIEEVDFQKHPVICKGRKNIYHCNSVIIATGAKAKWLGLPGETFFRGAGVSSCAICDGSFFRNKEVAVVGGGNSAAEEALTLAKHASLVTIIHRRDRLRAEKILYDRLKANPKIKFIWNHVIDGVEGSHQPKILTHLVIRDVITNEIQNLKTQGLFVAIGHSPNTLPFKDWINIDNEGYIITKPGSVETSVPGVFAAGDVQDKRYRQAVTAAGQGCMAALDVERFLESSFSDR